MKKFHKKRNESGQAMMELTLMLLILTGMMLAVIMLSGVEISGNTMLLSARHQAQIKSQTSSADSESGDELASWSTPSLRLNKGYIAKENGSFGSSTRLYSSSRDRYRIYSQNSGALPIPFSYSSRSSDNSGEHTISGAYHSLNSEIFSRPREDEFETFSHWRKLQEFDPALSADFTNSVTSGNAFNTAELVKGIGSVSSAPATLNSADQQGPHSVPEAVRVMYETFSKLFGIRVDAIRMRDHRSNRVYMPKRD